MKNYYVMLSDLKLAKERLKVLEERKEMLFRSVTNTVSVIKDIVVVDGASPDKMTEYTIKCEQIDKEIEVVKEEIKLLENSIEKMNKYLEESKDEADTERKVFIYYFKDGRRAEEIKDLVPCGIATVYRKINELKEKLNIDNK